MGAAVASGLAMKQLPLPMAPPLDERFAALVVGPNAAAVAHLSTLRPGLPVAAPVYLWGPAGSGKTRLLRALATEHQAGGGRVAWFDARTEPPWAWAEGCTLVVVDGCDTLDGPAQHAAFALFVEAGSQGVQWAAAGRVPPVDLALRDDLRSRLGWGHVFALAPLDEQQTRAALRREADRRGIWLSDDVMGYLLTRFARDLKYLMALLDQLDHFALAEQRAVTVPLLKKMLSEQPSVCAQQAPQAA